MSPEEKERELLEELVAKVVTLLKQCRERQTHALVSEEFAKNIVTFINTIWQGLKVPEDLKARLLEMIVDYTLRAALRIGPRKKKEEDSDQQYVPSMYFI